MCRYCRCVDIVDIVDIAPATVAATLSVPSPVARALEVKAPKLEVLQYSHNTWPSTIQEMDRYLGR